MDDVPSPTRAAPAGGSVEPANRAGVAKARFQTPAEPVGERFELRDPFADVLYRASRLPDMVAKADQLGSRRFVAIDAQGQRSMVEKVDGQWERGPQRPAAPARLPPVTTTRDEIPDLVAAAQAKERAPAQMHKAAAGRDKPTSAASVLPKIDADADRGARIAQLEAALQDRYLIKRAPVTIGDVSVGRTEYRFKGDSTRVAFTESTFKLSTDTNSPSVARSMIDVAEARNWRALRVSGNEEFKRLVWLEASVRGVKALGYEPNVADLDVLAKERNARQRNHIEAVPQAGGAAATTATTAQKGASGRGGGRKAVMAAIEAILVDQKVPPARRHAVLAAASEQLAQRVRSGPAPQVAVYDRAAPSQRPAGPTPDRSRGRDRTVPVR